MAASLTSDIANKATSAIQSVFPHKEGATLPTGYPVKDGSPDKSIDLGNESGKIVIVGVPGAFTPPCSSQVPGYVEKFEQFKAKGVANVFIVPINDVFTVDAWKEKLGAQSSGVRFVADDSGNFTRALGLSFDATGLLGGERASRYVIVAQDGKIQSVVKEDEPPSITVTAADKVLGSL